MYAYIIIFEFMCVYDAGGEFSRSESRAGAYIYIERSTYVCIHLFICMCVYTLYVCVYGAGGEFGRSRFCRIRRQRRTHTHTHTSKQIPIHKHKLINNYIYTCIHLYISFYTHQPNSEGWAGTLYICVCVCVYIHIYI